MSSQLERITAMEVRLRIVEEKISNMDKKLDDLLALKYKGAGAFWLASAMFGIIFTAVISLWKGH